MPKSSKSDLESNDSSMTEDSEDSIKYPHVPKELRGLHKSMVKHVTEDMFSEPVSADLFAIILGE